MSNVARGENQEIIGELSERCFAAMRNAFLRTLYHTLLLTILTNGLFSYRDVPRKENGHGAHLHLVRPLDNIHQNLLMWH